MCFFGYPAALCRLILSCYPFWSHISEFCLNLVKWRRDYFEREGRRWVNRDCKCNLQLIFNSTGNLVCCGYAACLKIISIKVELGLEPTLLNHGASWRQTKDRRPRMTTSHTTHTCIHTHICTYYMHCTHINIHVHTCIHMHTFITHAHTTHTSHTIHTTHTCTPHMHMHTTYTLQAGDLKKLDPNF